MAVSVETDGGVALVTIDRPKALNAFDLETLTALCKALEGLAVDEEARVVVLTGAGGKAFAAGADIKYMSGLDVAGAREWGALGHEAASMLEEMPKPTIAAIDGFALGGGCEMALACDLRYASPGSKLGQPEINLGLVPGWGGIERMARVAGVAVAKELVLTGRLVDAEEALRLGLVHELADPALDRARETAELLASKSPVALASAKRLLNRSLSGEHGDNLRAEAAEFADLFGSEDAKEGMTAFVEKRDANFTGR